MIRIFLLISSFFLINIAVSQTNTDCQIHHNNIVLQETPVFYEQTGQGEPLLLLHGLFGDKGQWRQVMCTLADAGYSVIAVDLPGFGESQNFPLATYSLEKQVLLQHQLLEALDIDKVHIAGSSMGGAIAALYAEKYPMQVITLIFWGAPLGIVNYSEPFKEAIYQGVNPLIPLSAEEFAWEMRLLFARTPDIPTDIVQNKIRDYQLNNRNYIRIWNIVNLYVDALNHDLSFNRPVLILWGEQDNIFDVSGAKKLADQFDNTKISVKILPDSGHLPYQDVPDISVKSVIEFLQSVNRLSYNND